MKKSFLVIIIAIVTVYASCLEGERKTPEQKIAAHLIAQVDQFAATTDQLKNAIEKGAPEQELQQRFLETRLTYKKIEWAAEYFAPAATRFVNGPPVPEIDAAGPEMAGPQVMEPQGLQVMESMLFPHYNMAGKRALLEQADALKAGCKQYRSRFAGVPILDWQVFDAAKLQVFRVLTLGITGFDCPLLQNSLAESAASLESLQNMLAYYTGENDREQLLPGLEAAVNYLKQHNDFNAFDRAEFITRYGNPLTIRLGHLEQRLNIHVVKYNRLLNQDALTLFDTGAFNLNAFTADFGNASTAAKVVLGRKLFADPVLSGNRVRSCQSCHKPELAFTDGLVANTLFQSRKQLRRNTPTLLNAALQPSQFSDARAATLEDQALDVMHNKDEMHGSLASAVLELWKDTAYRRLFASAFPRQNRTGIDTAEVLNAVGSYIRSLAVLNSRFDAYMRGNPTAMSAQELHGFNLFMGKAKCGTCHYMPLFNGTFPPRFQRIESEVIGAPKSADGKALDDDLGRYNIVKVDALKHAFKTVSVRNAGRTAPYMHNGVFTTLAQVVDFYDKGGGAGLGYKVDNQTLPFDRLNLSAAEKADLVAFIKSLDSREVSLP